MRNADCLDSAKYSDADNLLRSIKDTQGKLRAMKAPLANPEMIISRIRLYNVLLGEIRDVRNHLERELHNSVAIPLSMPMQQRNLLH